MKLRFCRKERKKKKQTNSFNKIKNIRSANHISTVVLLLSK